MLMAGWMTWRYRLLLLSVWTLVTPVLLIQSTELGLWVLSCRWTCCSSVDIELVLFISSLKFAEEVSFSTELIWKNCCLWQRQEDCVILGLWRNPLTNCWWPRQSHNVWSGNIIALFFWGEYHCIITLWKSSLLFAEYCWVRHLQNIIHTDAWGGEECCVASSHCDYQWKILW